MFSFLNTRNGNGLMGLDIGSDSIKLLKINSSGTPYKVENLAISPIPQGIITKDEIKDYAAIASILKDMIRMTGVKSKDVAFAIPRSSAIIKTILIDNRLEPEDIESRAWVEANRHFPDLVGDIHLDFAVLGPSPQDSSQLEVILVACRKDLIKPYLEILKLAGLTAKIVDVNSYALERSLSVIAKGMPELQTIALLNLDYTLSTFIVVQDNKLIYSHDQSFDGHRLENQAKAFTEKTLKGLPENPGLGDVVPTAEAVLGVGAAVPVTGTIPTTGAVPATGAVPTGAAPSMPAKSNPTTLSDMLKDSLSAHLRHTMHFFYSSRPNISIQKIILSGDCSIIPELVVSIQREIGIETILANPFANMVLDSNVRDKEIKEKASTLMLSCGLALSKLE